MFIDTHCHLDFPEFDKDREEVIKRAKEGGIDYIINIGSSLKSSVNSIALAQKYDFIYATVGVHPHDADNFKNEEENKLRKLAKKEKVVAIGEVGLDYYKNYSGSRNQKSLFTLLVSLSKELNLPLVIHSRQAENDTLEILGDFIPLKAVVHCFSGGEDFLKACLDLDFLISFTANITYKKAQNLRNITKITPLKKILLETDAPYLAPEGLRGRRNEPLNVKYVAEELAKIKAVSLDEIARITTNSAKDFFRIK